MKCNDCQVTWNEYATGSTECWVCGKDYPKTTTPPKSPGWPMYRFQWADLAKRRKAGQ